MSDQTELGQLRSLADTSAMINSSLDPNIVLEGAMDVIITLTGAERGYIILVDKDSGELDFRVSRESELMPMQGGGTPQISQTVLNEVLETGEALLADNAYKDERLQGGESIAQLTLRSVLCVPLLYREEMIGVVYVDNRLRSGVFTEREKNLLSAFSNQASVSIQNAQLYKSIQQSVIEIGEMKQLMDNVFDSIGSGVITTDAVHDVTTFNKAASMILEHAVEAVIGEKLGTVVPGVSANLDMHLNNILKEGENQTLEAELDVSKRGRIAVSMKLSPLKDAQRDTQGVAMVMDDLTDQRERDQVMVMMKRYLPPEMVDNIHAIAQIDLGGERREVTCAFIDVHPLTTFPADFGPKQVMGDLNIYLARATDVIHQHNGVIDKYIGNEIMILFNTQLNPMEEDHSLRAVQTALALRDEFVKIYAELGIDPDPHYYRIGLHTGIATLGNVGSLSRREFTALGDTINLSKRLEENAVSQQIIISEDTRRHLEECLGGQPEDMIFEELEALQVKGRQQKTRIYEVFRA